ncbi:16S rRNA G966 N2-methylase RsmD [Methylohalomonas lacus]|uniref:site-specific DNA-methyltransferase (adenine-specific) n=1 Tax=Methylohalomonas lacus TaxID=398773 RepID=A0AAE3HGY8_9GAMM|nr:DNA methyltransferase [Methylohalomonas lacus]MCS3902091.1 16S rRNA G966 N2-methylase RsmD [Methylohalomonas lacus]
MKRGSKATNRPGLDALYERALPAKRTGPLYGAFPYPTKISPEAIALYIASHTKPGDIVFDGFAGSGTTGLAALLCENPSNELRAEADRLGLQVEWGARNAVLYELGVLGAFIGKTLTRPPDTQSFREAANRILNQAERDTGWMYEAIDPDGNKGALRHAVWSDLLRCPACQRKVTMWDACVSLEPARIESAFHCPYCDHQSKFDQVERLIETVADDVTGDGTERRARKLARIYGVTGKTRWSRSPTKADLALLDRIADEPIPDCVPNVFIPWGDLHRRGYHEGITHLHHFYTRRNLIVFARLWELTEDYDSGLRDALRFWLLSYNAAHATIMTRVVAKSGQKDLVVTSAQPGVLYVSGLPVEKNLFAGLQRKLKTIAEAFSVVHGRSGKVEVLQASSCAVDLPDGSIDYVFTDPPFGGNIPYAEISFINEAWLGDYTNRAEEIIVSNSQRKTLKEYQELFTTALSEVRRILKPHGQATLVFHSASADVWNALQAAYSDAGLNVECAGVLNKTQGSFKQVTSSGAVRGDPVLLLGKDPAAEETTPECVWTIAAKLSDAALTLDPSERTPQRLYSRLVGHFLTKHQKVPFDADDFYHWHDTHHSAKATGSAED